MSSTQHQCRICLEEEETDANFIVPCRCRGSSKYIHRTCLDTWRSQNPNGENFKRCNQCRMEYVIESGPEFNQRKADNMYKKHVRDEGWIIMLVVIFVVIVTAFALVAWNAIRIVPFKSFRRHYVIGYVLMTIILLSFISGIFGDYEYRSQNNGIICTTFFGFVHITQSCYNNYQRNVSYHYSKIYMRHVSSQQSVKDFKGREHEIPVA